MHRDVLEDRFDLEDLGALETSQFKVCYYCPSPRLHVVARAHGIET
jgi:hypothetical protein